MRWLPTWPMQGAVTVLLSTDGTTWYQLRTVQLGQQQPDTWLTVPVGYHTRYVKLRVSLGSAGAVGSLAEVEMWLDPAGAGQPITSLQLVTPTPPAPAAVPTPVPPPPPPPAPTDPPVVESAPATEVMVDGT